MQFRWRRAERPGAPAVTGRNKAGPSAEPVLTPSGCGWFDSSDELRRGLEVSEADAGSVPSAVSPGERAGAG